MIIVQSFAVVLDKKKKKKLVWEVGCNLCLLNNLQDNQKARLSAALEASVVKDFCNGNV